MIRELFFNGQKLDISDLTKIPVTIQANRIGDLQSRQANFAPIFKVKLNARNKSIIQQSHVINSSSKIPYRYGKLTYLENGIEILSEAKAKISVPSDDYFEISASSGNSTFFNLIEGITVGELYESDPTFFFEIYTILNSRVGNDYYTFPIIDWTKDEVFFTGNQIDTESLVPTAIVSKMMERLAAKIGYTFFGPYLNTDSYNNLILTPDKFSLLDEYLSDSASKASYSYSGSAGFPIGTGGFDSFYLPEGSGGNIFNVKPFENAFIGNFSLNLYTPTILEVGSLRFSTILNVAWGAYNYGAFQIHQKSSYHIVSRIMRTSDNAVMAEVTNSWSGKADLTDITSFSGFQTNSFVISIETGDIPLSPTDSYYIYHYFFATAHTNNDTKIYMRQGETSFSLRPSNILTYGSEISFPSLFRMTVKDVLMDIFREDGVFIQTNEYQNTVQLNQWKDVANNKSIARDWSKKMIISDKSLEFRLEGYAQKNFAKFKENSEVDSLQGEGSFLIDDETLTEELDVVQMNHSATMQNPRYIGINTPSIYGFDSSNKWQDPGWRLLRMDRREVTSGLNWKYLTSLVPFSTFAPIAKFVGFDDLLDQNYSDFINALNDFKGLTIPLKLSQIDLRNFDHSIPIYLNREVISITGYFYVSRIDKGIKGFSTLELMKLP